jgi:hypothetical protein
MAVFRSAPGDAAAAEAHYAKGYALQSEPLTAYYHASTLRSGFRFPRRPRRPPLRPQVLEIVVSVTSGEADEWLDATEGEAQLILGNAKAAFAAYKRFVTAGNDPWKVGSCYLNARTIAADLANRNLARELGKIFEDPQP